MRNIQKVIATGISLAMATTMCVAVPATAAFAAETAAAVTATEGENADLMDISEAIKSTYSIGDQLYMGEPVKPLGSISFKNSLTTPQRALYEGTDYTVVYENNDAIGKATATITGLESAGLTGSKTFEFNIIEFSIKVTYKNEAGETKDIKTLDHQAVVDLMKNSDDNKVDLYYQHGVTDPVAYFVPAGSYLTYDSIMRAVGVTGWKHTTGIATDGFAGSPVSAEINNYGMFFPAQTTTARSTDGGYHVPAIITTEYASQTIETTAKAAAMAASKKEMTKAVKLFSGVLQDEYVNDETAEDALTGKRLATNICTFAIDSYTPLKANPIKVSASKKSVKNNAKQTVTIKAKNAKGTVTYAVKSAPSKKAVKVSKKGVVTIAKGAKTGKYVISVKAAGNKSYKAATKTVTIKVTK